ncbi:MAG: DNA-protecting protein DprA [Candidatus Pacebacteria bacterium]|nr:DNA-protecting protein DprA [Candidatus Paceibacterota bacterium]
MQEDNKNNYEDNHEEIFSIKILKEDFARYKLLSRLLEIHDTPKSLNIKAKNEDVLNEILNKNIKGKDFKILTIVGSRKNSYYGKEVVEYLLKKIAGENIFIVSGLALGIDSLAHVNALKNNLRTISVPGSGLSKKVIYPSANINLAQEILNNDGILISEYDDDRKSELYFFPSRNRVMAAISDAVLIIEAGEKSGTLITGRLAMEYGKNVGVIPNNIFAEGSSGSNELIKNGATPVTKVEDILEMLNLSREGNGILDLNFNKKEDNAKLKEILDSLSDNERFVLEKIIQSGNVNKEILIKEMEENFDMNYTDSLVSLMSLEINGFIKEELGEIRIVK